MQKGGLLIIFLLLILTFVVSDRALSQDDTSIIPRTSDRVHIFYYPWYGNPATDGGYNHWNHRKEARRFGGERYPGGDDIGSSFYPRLGCYSSNDTATVRTHMRQIRDSGAGVVSISWWGPRNFEDNAVPLVMTIAAEFGLKVNFLIEPYHDNTADGIRDALVYIMDTYGSHPAFFRDKLKNNLPVFYIFFAERINSRDWKSLLFPKGKKSIRGTDYDAIMIGVWFETDSFESDVVNSHFDGIFTYAPVDGMMDITTVRNWKRMNQFVQKNDLIFAPSVGPGYSDIRIRDWHGNLVRGRQNGAYYDKLFQAAIEVDPYYITITSYNEWPEGTQIEPAIPKSIPGYTYSDYAPLDPEYYLRRTRYWVEKYMKKKGEW